jgi:two-component system chemotaxis sensor kinase CheA
MIDKALLGDYISESEQLLETLAADLDLVTESAGFNKNSKHPQKPGQDPPLDVVNRVFRTVHSIKGLMGMMELTQIQGHVHRFETVLDDIRLGKLALSRDLSMQLQEVAETLAATIGDAARNVDPKEKMGRLHSMLDGLLDLPRVRAKKGPQSLASLRLSDHELKLLTPFERHRTSENLSAGRSFFEVRVEFQVNELDSRYRSLASMLGDRGELITTLPGKSASKQSIGLKLLLAADIKENELESLVKPFGASVARIGPSPWRRAGAVLKSAGRRKRDQERAGVGPLIPKGKNDARVQTTPPALSSAPAAPAAQDSESRGVDDAELGGFRTVLPAAMAQDSFQSLSHSVRVDLSQIDEVSGLTHELYIEVERLSSMAGRIMAQAQGTAKDRFDLRQCSRSIERQFLELEERLVELRMVSLAQTFSKAGRLAERLAKDLGKEVKVALAGRGTQIDKMIVDRIGGPIYHVLRNAVDHGIEPADERLKSGKPPVGTIKIEATLEGTQAVISISDDGRGIDPDKVLQRAREVGSILEDEQLSDHDVLRLIFRSGFSTASQVSAVSGRGVGLDDVERVMYDLGGEIRVSSEKGKGSRFELAVPTTLVMISAFIVSAADWRYAVNVGQIVELIYVTPADIAGIDGKRKIKWRGGSIPLVELRYLLGLGGARRLEPAAAASMASSPSYAGVSTPTLPLGRPLEPKHSEWVHRQPQRPRPPSRGPDTRVPAFITRLAHRPVAVAVERFDDQREIIVKSMGPLARNIRGIAGAVDLEGGEVALVLDLPGLLMMRSIRA